MNDDEFDGSLVLEKLAAVGKVNEFYSAVDADDFATARVLLARAGLDADTIATVLKKMHDADGEH